MPFDPEKLAELVLYISRRSEGDETFGAVKLNKILFFSDFAAYRTLGQPITGATYRKLPYGPVPAELRTVCERLVQAHDASEARRLYFGKEQTRLLAMREPDLARFSGPEIAVVDDVISQLWQQDASTVSELSHQFIGWKAAASGEAIPYETALLTIAEPGSADFARADELSALYGWKNGSAR